VILVFTLTLTLSPRETVRERGRPTEVDFLNGYICARARERNVPTPLNDAVVGLIKEIESGKRPIAPANIKDPILHRLVP